MKVTDKRSKFCLFLLKIPAKLLSCIVINAHAQSAVSRHATGTYFDAILDTLEVLLSRLIVHSKNE